MQKSDKTNSQNIEKMEKILDRFIRGENWKKPIPKELSQPNRHDLEEKKD